VINVGAINSSQSYHVDFFNSGATTLKYITGTNRQWITIVTPATSTIAPIQSQRITITIDPTKFEAGRTTGKVLVISNNGNAVLSIKAVGKYPEISVLPIEDPFPNTFRSEVTFNGNHTFKEMGYCFSHTNSLPTTNDNYVLANDIGSFTYKDYWSDSSQFPWIGNLNWVDEVCQTWYVSAFLTYENETDTIIYSSNVEQFILWDILCP
jgi:hypothetical protein